MKTQAAVIICCYTEDRWDALCASINSALGQEFDDFHVIVVVDYNPTLQARVAVQFPTVRVIENRGRKGLSGARNTGIRAANARYIAFLDDDAVAEPNWLYRLCEPMADPNVMGVVGNILPKWLGKHPAWFPQEFYWVFGCTYRGIPVERSEVRNLIGGCMCVRAEVFNQVGGFRSEIGRIGTIPLGGEETEFCIRAHQANPMGKFIYEPSGRIYHEVPPKRTTWRYFRARCYAEGLSKALIARLVGARDGLASESAYTVRILPTGVLYGLRDVVLRGDLHGLQRALAIVAGLVVTATGYTVGRFRIQAVNLPHPALIVGELE
jgi:GT2 family glycosyltransferase